MAERHDESTSSKTDDEPSGPRPRRRRSRRREDTPNFSFIHFTSEASFRPGRAQKAVRAQAARASSNRRLATIEKRREAKRANSIDPTIKLETASEGFSDDNKLSPLSSGILSPLIRPRSAPPSVPRDGAPNAPARRNSLPAADEWICDLNMIVQDTLQSTLRTMSRLQIPCDTVSLLKQFQEVALYHHPLTIQCLELLAATATDHQQRSAMSRSIIVLLRHRLIVAVQAIIQADVKAKKLLACVVALLAGWEAEHGEGHACEFHLHALAGLLPTSGKAPAPFQVAIDLVDISGLFMPITISDMPVGFRFYRSLGLLPTCLVDSISSMNEVDISGAALQDIAVAALACRPSDGSSHDTHQQHGLVNRVCHHIRTAAALLATLLANEGSADGDLDHVEDRLSAWHAESTTLGTESLFGTVYDEVLIWSLCVFVGAVRRPAADQVKLLKTELKKIEVIDVEALEALLARYVAPRDLLDRLSLASRF